MGTPLKRVMSTFIPSLSHCASSPILSPETVSCSPEAASMNTKSEPSG
jgi:hypothetical protein